MSTVSNISSNDEAAVIKKSLTPLSPIARARKYIIIARALLLFSVSIGYSLLASASLTKWQQYYRLTTDKFDATRIALIALILREAWRLCPHWLKPRIIRFVTGLIHMITAPIRQFIGYAVTAADDNEAAKKPLAASTSSNFFQQQESQEDDITDLSNFITKVKQVLHVAKSKIEAEEHSSGEAYKISEMRLSLLAHLQLLWQIKARRGGSRDELYRGSGERVEMLSSSSPLPNNQHVLLLTGADEMFELADLAYNEHVSGEDLKVVLKGMGYDLIKHDATNPVPGYLGHYVAIRSDDDGSLLGEENSSSFEKKKKEKIAVIGIKGTSTLEDLLTDMCANSVEYTLDRPFYQGGSNKLRCHEGVYISSQRLVVDLLPLVKNLLIPSGYKIVIVGHSLGAGCATIVSLLLRASIPSLQTDSDNLKVWAFASPPVLDLTSSRGCSSFVTTIVNNCDVVPRFNIGPFVVTVRLLRAMHKRLKERNLGMTDLLLKDWLKKSHKDLEEEEDADEMLMSVEEYVSAITDAISRSDDHDPDHLYVPGKVLVLYDLWEKEQLLEDGRRESNKDYATILKEWMQHLKEEDTLRSSIDEDDSKNATVAEEAILSDGTCKALRLIEFDSRLVDDHLACSYRSSIANILSSMGNAAGA